MPSGPAWLWRAATTLGLCGLLAPARRVSAQNLSAQGASAAQLIEKLGLHVAPQPVRERPGWRPPRIVLVNKQQHDLLPCFSRWPARRSSSTSPPPRRREIAARRCHDRRVLAEVLRAGEAAAVDPVAGRGVERCVQQP